jgi:hypothetical protein
MAVSIAVFASILISPVASATDHETQCFNDVQGKILWTDENVKQLCKGTTKPSEPGKCFQTVNSGQVEWGKGIKSGNGKYN